MSPRCPCRSAALTTQGKGTAGSPAEKTRGWGTAAACEPLTLARLRRREHGGGAVDRVREAEPLGDAGGDPDRPVGAGRDDPVDVARPCEPLDPGLVLGGDDRALGREGEAGRERVAVGGDHLEAPRRRRLEQPELGRPGA